jgi:phytoene/squalene synthetase
MSAIRRIALVRYVFSRLSALKGGYRRELEAAFAPAPVPSYFATPRGRARVLGYLLGLEAWHQVVFGDVLGRPAGRWLVPCAAAAYDDAVDSEGSRAWSALEQFLATGGGAHLEFGPGAAATALAPSLTQLARRSGCRWDLLRDCLLAINEATRQGFETTTQPSPEPGALRRVTYDKGGRSFQLLTALAGDGVRAGVLQLAYDFGAACQLADDIYDVEEDVRSGQCTLASGRLIGEEDRRLLEGAADRLPAHAAAVPALMVDAWRTHLRSALRAYDAGSRRSAWRHDLGQAAFRFGIRVVPGRS